MAYGPNETGECDERREGGPHRRTPGAPGDPDWCYYCERLRSHEPQDGRQAAPQAEGSPQEGLSLLPVPPEERPDEPRG